MAAYSQIFHNLFVLYDDPEYITDNGNVLNGLTINSVAWAFSSVYQGNWHPLTWISHMLDIELFGLNPAGHHAMGLLLHVGNALLIFAILQKMTGKFWRSATVSLLFALHPLHVESVAWASERKDLLCAFFGFLSIWVYAWYVERPGWRRYSLLLMVFSAGLLSKPMFVTFPFVLLLLDYWPLRRILTGNVSRPLVCIGEKIPLLLLSIIVSVVTFRAQIINAPLSHRTPLFYNISNALQAYTGYLRKTFLPVKLAVAYPFNISQLTMSRTVGSALLISAITIWAFRKWRSQPYLITGWLWFLGTLIPVIGFVKIGIMGMADRYSYIPHIGLFIMISWWCADLVMGNIRAQKVLAVIAIVVMITLTVLTANQVRYWQNGITLMQHAIEVTEDNWFANNNLGAAFLLVGSNNRTYNITASLPLEPATLDRREAYLKKSIIHCTEALRISPSFPLAHFNLGSAYLNLGNREAALNEYRTLLSLDPNLASNLRYFLDL